jgi:hypothetical protein
MSYEVIGKLVAKYDTVQRTQTFKTREFVIEKTDEIGGRTISNFIKFQCVQDKTAMVDRVNVGDTVKILFNLKGTRWEKNGQVNYITNLDAWRIEQVLSPSGGQDAPHVDSEYTEPLDTFTDTSNNAVDDLPF